MKNRKLAIISDIHGKIDQWFRLCTYCESLGYDTIQIGDFGFADAYNVVNTFDLDPMKHMMFKGNHDARNMTDCRYDIGKYGLVPRYPEIFFVSGGFSIDYMERTPGKNWWHDEELSIDEMQIAFDTYVALKPDYLLTHEPPRIFGNIIGNPKVLKAYGYDPDRFSTRTSNLIQRMIEAHKPKVVVSGHLHVTSRRIIDDVEHVCVPELGIYTLELP